MEFKKFSASLTDYAHCKKRRWGPLFDGGRASRIFIRGALSVDKNNNGDVMGTFKTSQLLADKFKKGYNEMLIVIESRLAKPAFTLCRRGCKTVRCGHWQGQARGYGRITHFMPLPTWDHDFYNVNVTQQVGVFQIPGCKMKHMGIIFPKIPFVLL